MPRKRKNPETCTVHGCKEPAETRGLCASCYQSARRRVQVGDTSWEKLERTGLCRPLRRGRTAFSKVYQEA